MRSDLCGWASFTSNVSGLSFVSKLQMDVWNKSTACAILNAPWIDPDIAFHIQYIYIYFIIHFSVLGEWQMDLLKMKYSHFHMGRASEHCHHIIKFRPSTMANKILLFNITLAGSQLAPTTNHNNNNNQWEKHISQRLLSLLPLSAPFSTPFFIFIFGFVLIPTYFTCTCSSNGVSFHVAPRDRIPAVLNCQK